MNSEEKFKQSLNDLLGSKQFEFTNQDWENASKIIDAGKRKKRRFFFYWVFGLLLLSTGSVFIIVNSNGDLIGNSESKIVSEKSLALVNEKDEAAKSSASTEQSFNPSNKTSEGKASTPLQNTKEFSSDKEEVGQLINIKKSESTMQSLIPTSQKNDSTREVKPSEGIKSGIIVLAAAISQSTKVKEGALNNDTNKAVTPETKAKKDDETNESEVKQGDKPLAWNDGNNNPKEEKAPVIKKTESDVTKKEEAITKVKESIPDQNNTITTTKPAKSDSSLAAKPDTIIAKPYPSDLMEPENKKPLVSIEAGGTYLFGWKNANGKDAKGWSPTFGINYFNWLNQNMALSFGIQYNQINKLTYSSYTSKITTFGFGEESRVTVYTPLTLHYITLPLRLNYVLGKNNYFGCGLNISYLVDAKSKVETYDETFGEGFNGKQNYASKNEYGYTQGFKPYDTQLSAFYRRVLLKRFSLGIELFYGLTDVKNANYFKTNKPQRNNGIKLTIAYYFFKGK